MVSFTPGLLSSAFGAGKLYAYRGASDYKKWDLSGYILSFLDDNDLRVIPCLNRNWRLLMDGRKRLYRLSSEEYLPGTHDQYGIKRSLHRSDAEAILKQTGVEIPFPAGENFLEHYSLGHGSFGEFCIGYAWQKAHYVGIKITLGNHAVEAEAKVQQALSKQPHIMPALDTYRAINPDGQVAFYQVMELAGLGSADKLQAALSKLDGKFREQVLFWLAEGLLQGLSEMHQAGFCHLDIKPHNIAVQHNGSVRLIDFGCAARMKDRKIDVREQNGDVSYFSPERWLAYQTDKPLQDGTKIDVWAAGLTLLILANPKQSAVHDIEELFFEMEELSKKRDAAIQHYVQSQMSKIPALQKPASDSFESLICTLLVPAPERRSGPVQALQHPWMKKMRANFESVKKEVLGYLCEFVQAQQRIQRTKKKSPTKNVQALSPQDLPLPHFTSFVERPTIQSQLEKMLFSVSLSTYRSKAPLLACQGMGGVGKTQLLTYMIHSRKIQDRYGLRLWFRSSDNSQQLTAQCMSLARELGLIDDKAGVESAISELQKYLAKYPERHGKPWLIVFDNAESLEVLAPYLPPSGGHCVVTTRSPNWKEVLPVDVLTPQEGKDLVRKLLLREDPRALELCKELGYHTLGIVQACAFLRNQQMSVQPYMERIRNRASVLQKDEPLFGK